jgi:hypothetical protein
MATLHRRTSTRGFIFRAFPHAYPGFQHLCPASWASRTFGGGFQQLIPRFIPRVRSAVLHSACAPCLGQRPVVDDANPREPIFSTRLKALLVVRDRDNFGLECAFVLTGF